MAFVITDVVTHDGIAWGIAAYWSRDGDPQEVARNTEPDDTEVQPIDRGLIEMHLRAQPLLGFPVAPGIYNKEPLAGLLAHAKARAYLRLEHRIPKGVKVYIADIDVDAASVIYHGFIAGIWERTQMDRGALPQLEIAGEPSKIEVGRWI